MGCWNNEAPEFIFLFFSFFPPMFFIVVAFCFLNFSFIDRVD